MAGRGGSGCRGADRGRGSPEDPKNMKTQLKKSLESNKPSVPGASGTDLKGEKGGQFKEYSTILLAEKDPYQHVYNR